MPLQGSTQSTILPAIGLALSLAYANAAVGQNVQTLKTYDVVNPPPCTNNKGETVRFVENNRGRSGVAVNITLSNNKKGGPKTTYPSADGCRTSEGKEKMCGVLSISFFVYSDRLCWLAMDIEHPP
jgi:hypothetical protein